jgi:Swt1-like HEPN
MNHLDELKVFAMNRSLFQADLLQLGNRYEIEHIPEPVFAIDRDETFYPQFPKSLRDTAHEMAQHYEIFYCLENFIRDLVVEQLKTTYGEEWWSTDDPKTVVSQVVKDNVSKNRDRERDAGVTPRSDDAIDYTTFGELSTIIDSNWDTFGDMFNSRKGLISVLSRLNLLRGPIAHCSELSEDEVVRLRLTLADWFRLMG